MVLLIGGLACVGLAFLFDRDWWMVLDEDWDPEGIAGVVIGTIGLMALGGALWEAGGMLL